MHRARCAGRARRPLPRSRVARDERASARERASERTSARVRTRVTHSPSRLSIVGSENFGNPPPLAARADAQRLQRGGGGVGGKEGNRTFQGMKERARATCRDLKSTRRREISVD